MASYTTANMFWDKCNYIQKTITGFAVQDAPTFKMLPLSYLTELKRSHIKIAHKGMYSYQQ